MKRRKREKEKENKRERERGVHSFFGNWESGDYFDFLIFIF